MESVPDLFLDILKEEDISDGRCSKYIVITVVIEVQCILGYPNLDYPNPRLSEPPNNYIHKILMIFMPH